MNETARMEMTGMKNESLLLNLICILFALGFVALAVFSFFWAGTFLSIDSLFFTAVCLMVAGMFAIIPVSWLVSTGKLKLPFMKASASATTPAAKKAPAAAAASARPAVGAKPPAAGLPASSATPAPASTVARPEPVRTGGSNLPPDVRGVMDQVNKRQPADKAKPE